jgi:hypothetical protein
MLGEKHSSTLITMASLFLRYLIACCIHNYFLIRSKLYASNLVRNCEQPVSGFEYRQDGDSSSLKRRLWR